MLFLDLPHTQHREPSPRIVCEQTFKLQTPVARSFEKKMYLLGLVIQNPKLEGLFSNEQPIQHASLLDLDGASADLFFEPPFAPRGRITVKFAPAVLPDLDFDLG